MEAVKHCERCIWWSFTYQDGHRCFGTCESIFVQERVRLSQDYDSVENDEPAIFTEATFGCQFYETEGGLAVVKIDPTRK